MLFPALNVLASPLRLMQGIEELANFAGRKARTKKHQFSHAQQLNGWRRQNRWQKRTSRRSASSLHKQLKERQTKNDDHDQLLNTIACSSSYRIPQVVRVAISIQENAADTISRIRDIDAGTTTVRGFEADHYDLGYLVKVLGGVGLQYALQKAVGLPCV